MKRDRFLTKVLKITVCAFLFAGLFLQICLLAEISGTAKQKAKAESEIAYLQAQKDNLELQIAKYERTTWIEEQARELGMAWPEDDQIRVISMPKEYMEASTHTAEITGSR